MGKKVSFNKTPLVDEDIAYPCGLIARSLFNDTYNITSGTATESSFFLQDEIPINENNIAWKTDIEYKYKN